MELYYIIAITDHDRGEAMGSLYHAAGLHLILSMPARGTATSEHLAIYGLDATEKCVIAAVGSAQEADSLIRSAKRKLFIDIPGNGVMLTVPLKSVAGGKTLSYLTDDLKAGGAPNMNFEHELITVILNEGYSDFVMDAARAAGAGGGTVLHAKGTGGTRGEKFFSVSLADELEVLVAESALVELQHLISHITESGRVVDGGSLSDGTEQQLGNQLTGRSSVEVNALDVLEHAELLRGLRNMERPVSAGELVVLVVANRAEDHGEDFIAGDLAGGLEGSIGIALDQLGIGAVADVALSPTGASHVAELVVGGVHGSLGILDVSGVHAIHDRGHLSAGDIALGLEGTILITLEHTHAVQNGNSLSVIIADALVILEGVGADGQRQSHDQSQHHCE